MLLFLLIEDVTADRDPTADPIMPSAPSERARVAQGPRVRDDEDEDDDELPASSTLSPFPFPSLLFNKPLFSNSYEWMEWGRTIWRKWLFIWSVVELFFDTMLPSFIHAGDSDSSFSISSNTVSDNSVPSISTSKCCISQTKHMWNLNGFNLFASHKNTENEKTTQINIRAKKGHLKNEIDFRFAKSKWGNGNGGSSSNLGWPWSMFAGAPAIWRSVFRQDFRWIHPWSNLTWPPNAFFKIE